MELSFLKYCAVCALFLLGGCSERIEISTKDAPPRLVIYSHLTDDLSYQNVRITRSGGYFDTTAPVGISGAVVKIICGSQVLVLQQSADEPGLYVTDDVAVIVPGSTYELDVEVDFNGDGQRRRYLAQTYMPMPASVDAVAIIPSTTFRDYMEVYIDGTLPVEGSGHNFSLHVWRNEQMLNDSLSQFTLFDDKDLVSNSLQNVPCFYLDQKDERTRLSEGDNITVGIDAITEEYAEFLNVANTEASGSIPFFSGPPANVPTNIRPADPSDDTPLAGFFTAFSRASMTVAY